MPTLLFVASTTNVLVSTVSDPPVIAPDAVRVVLLMVEGNLALAIVPVNADESRSVSEAPEPLNVPPVIVPDAVRVVLLMVEGSLALSIVPVNADEFKLVSEAPEPLNVVAFTVPLTSSFSSGLVFAIPMLPFERMVIRCVLEVLKVNFAALSFVISASPPDSCFILRHVLALSSVVL